MLTNAARLNEGGAFAMTQVISSLLFRRSSERPNTFVAAAFLARYLSGSRATKGSIRWWQSDIDRKADQKTLIQD